MLLYGTDSTNKELIMDEKLITPFLESTLYVLQTIAGIEAEKGKPYLKKDNVARGDLSGVIGLTCPLLSQKNVFFI